MEIIDKSITYTFFYALPLMLLLLFYVQFYVAIYLKKKARVGVASKISALLLTIILPFSGPLISPVVLIVSLLFIFIAANLFFIKKHFYNRKGKEIITISKWLGVFALIYILLLPLGGYRPYRPNTQQFTVLSWHVITDYKQSKLNAKLLRIWRITDSEKLYYHKLRQKY